MIRKSTERCLIWLLVALMGFAYVFSRPDILNDTLTEDWAGNWTPATVLAFSLIAFLIGLFSLKDASSTSDTFFIEYMRGWRDRILLTGHPDSEFIAEHLNDKVIVKLSRVLDKPMRKTLRDSKVRSVTLTVGKVCFFIHTISEHGTVKVRRFFNENWRSYGEALNAMRDSDEVSASNADVFCHIVFGASMIDVTMLPFHSDIFRELPIVAITMLNEVDRAKMGSIVDLA